MKFIDTVTIFHKIGETYERKVVEGCYWYGNTGIAVSGHGIVHDDTISVFFPKEVVEQYNLVISKNDRIIKGEVEDIISVNELAKYEDKITVLTVQKNTVGSKLDNLLVTGK